MLNQRQRKFCEYYVNTGNITTAAIKAGYTESYAKNKAYKLLSNDGVCSYIEELNKAGKTERVATMEEIQAFWTSKMRDNEANINARIKVSELLAKSKGAFIDKSEISVKPVVITGENFLED